jgi:hypothetical protein
MPACRRRFRRSSSRRPTGWRTCAPSSRAHSKRPLVPCWKVTPRWADGPGNRPGPRPRSGLFARTRLALCWRCTRRTKRGCGRSSVPCTSPRISLGWVVSRGRSRTGSRGCRRRRGRGSRGWAGTRLPLPGRCGRCLVKRVVPVRVAPVLASSSRSLRPASGSCGRRPVVLPGRTTRALPWMLCSLPPSSGGLPLLPGALAAGSALSRRARWSAAEPQWPCWGNSPCCGCWPPCGKPWDGCGCWNPCGWDGCCWDGCCCGKPCGCDGCCG